VFSNGPRPSAGCATGSTRPKRPIEEQVSSPPSHSLHKVLAPWHLLMSRGFPTPHPTRDLSGARCAVGEANLPMRHDGKGECRPAVLASEPS
jgi:hypothetical protein